MALHSVVAGSLAVSRVVIGPLLRNVQVVVGRGRWAVDALALLTIVAIGTVLAAVVAVLLHVAIAVTASFVSDCAKRQLGVEGTDNK